MIRALQQSFKWTKVCKWLMEPGGWFFSDSNPSDLVQSPHKSLQSLSHWPPAPLQNSSSPLSYLSFARFFCIRDKTKWRRLHGFACRKDGTQVDGTLNGQYCLDASLVNAWRTHWGIPNRCKPARCRAAWTSCEWAQRDVTEKEWVKEPGAPAPNDLNKSEESINIF